MRAIPDDTDTFHFVNVNPKGKRAGDCVFRAIANAFQITWREAVKACTALALKKGLAPNDKACYTALLEIAGVHKAPQPRKSTGGKYKGWEFCKANKTGRCIVAHIGLHHLSVVRKGKIEDTWDCSNRCVGTMWLIPEGEQLKEAQEKIRALAYCQWED